jgi:hypothetical protein
MLLEILWFWFARLPPCPDHESISKSRPTARRLSRTQRGRVSAPASVGSNRWLGRRERSEPGLPAGAARRAVKPSAKRSA